MPYTGLPRQTTKLGAALAFDGDRWRRLLSPRAGCLTPAEVAPNDRLARRRPAQPNHKMAVLLTRRYPGHHQPTSIDPTPSGRSRDLRYFDPVLGPHPTVRGLPPIREAEGGQDTDSGCAASSLVRL